MPLEQAVASNPTYSSKYANNYLRLKSALPNSRGSPSEKLKKLVFGTMEPLVAVRHTLHELSSKDYIKITTWNGISIYNKTPHFCLMDTQESVPS
jgi:hypothetical protein